MYSHKASTSRITTKDDNRLINEYGMTPDEEYISLSDRKKNVVNQIIFQLLSGKKPHYSQKEDKYYRSNNGHAMVYISDIYMGTVRDERYDKLFRVAKSEADKLAKSSKFKAILEQKNKEQLARQKIQQQQTALEMEAENKRKIESEWLGLSTIWAMNSGFKKIQNHLNEKVDAKQLIKKLISLNSGDRRWAKGPYGSEIINAVYHFHDVNYDEVGNKLESYLTENSKYSSGLLYRGTTADEFSQWMKGRHIATRFVPTSYVESTAKDFGQYIIEIENGYGKNVHNIYQNGYEAEFLINRGSKFELVSNQGDKRIRVRQIV